MVAPCSPTFRSCLIATARLLREQGRGEAEAVLDRLLENKATAEAPASRPAGCTGRPGRGLRPAVALERGRSVLSSGDRVDRLTRRSSAPGGSTWPISRIDQTTKLSARLHSGPHRRSPPATTSPAARPTSSERGPSRDRRASRQIDEHDRQIQGRRHHGGDIRKHLPRNLRPAEASGPGHTAFTSPRLIPRRRVGLICGLGLPGHVPVHLLGQPRTFLLRLDDRRELQPRFPRPADQPLLRQPGGRARAGADPRGRLAGQSCCSSSPWPCDWSRFRCRSRSWATSPS